MTMFLIGWSHGVVQIEVHIQPYNAEIVVGITPPYKQFIAIVKVSGIILVRAQFDNFQPALDRLIQELHSRTGRVLHPSRIRSNLGNIIPV